MDREIWKERATNVVGITMLGRPDGARVLDILKLWDTEFNFFEKIHLQHPCVSSIYFTHISGITPLLCSNILLNISITSRSTSFIV